MPLMTEDSSDDDWPRIYQWLANQVIAEQVSENIEQIHPELALGWEDETLTMDYQFQSLAEAVWWHLGRFVSGQRDLAKCQGCGHFFERKDGRQIYCPPPEQQVLEARVGQRSRAQSLCAGRDRMRRYRARKGASRE